MLLQHRLQTFHPPLCPNESLSKKKKIQHEFCLAFLLFWKLQPPPALLHPPHINHQSEAAACTLQMGSHSHALRTRETRSPVNRARLQLIWPQPQLCAFVCSAEYRCPLRPFPFAWEVGINGLRGKKLLHRAYRCGMVHSLPLLCLPFSFL